MRTVSRIVTLPYRALIENSQTGTALSGSLQSVTIPDTVHIQFFLPEEEHNDARNMSRNIV